ncbi:hypothetical protein [Dyadobacter luteus]|uniref:hypothetical protein n=1 Tax=Dyadobacter luteus TaxID=2259619 RepID=UPI001E520E15|nr:hypothetical protein [Dyadobacter luteus]
MRHTTILLFFTIFILSFSSFGQVKIGANPTVIDPANNLEVESSTTGNKISINKTNGKMTVADGSQGAGRILTSDANGVATWTPPAAIRVEETVFVGEQGPDPYVVTGWEGTFNVLKDRIPLAVRPGSLPGYNPATKQYTIQESGYYRVFAGAGIVGTLPFPRTTDVVFYLHPWQVFNNYLNIDDKTGPVLSSFWQAYLPAGSVVDIYVTVNYDGGPAQYVVVKNAFLSIVKMF